MARITVVIVDPDGSARKTKIENTLGAFQSIVDGYIEGVFDPDFTVYLNEDGMGLRLPVNQRITEHLDWPRSLLGTALIVGPSDEEGYDTDVPDHIISYYELEN